jgi:hypothetical protein
VKDIRQRIEASQTWLREFGLQIPGYGAYLEREQRRDADKALREQLAAVLDRARTRLNEARAALADAGHLSLMGYVERADKELSRVAGKLRYATRGYTGFFDAVKIDNEALDRVYEHDAAMLEAVRQAADTAAALVSAQPEQMKEQTQELVDALQGIEARVEERDSLLRGLDAPRTAK